MKILSQLKKLSIATIIIAAVSGTLFILFPDKCIKYISLAVGIAFIAFGIAGIINYLIDKTSSFGLLSGIIIGIIGIIVCFKYKQIISLIVIIIGIFVLVTGIVNFFTGIKVISSSIIFGWVTLILAIVTIVFGIIAVTKSTQLTESIVQFIGVALIVYAVMDIVSYFQVRRIVKNVKTKAAAAGDIETDGTIVEDA